MAAGARLLDAQGRRILMDDGKLHLSDGTGDDCCCDDDGDPCDCITETFTVASITRSGTTATVTLDDPHGILGGLNGTVTIAGASPVGYNGAKTVAITGTHTFTYAASDTLTTPATGTITATFDPANCTRCACTPYSYRVTFADVTMCPGCLVLPGVSRYGWAIGDINAITFRLAPYTALASTCYWAGRAPMSDLTLRAYNENTCLTTAFDLGVQVLLNRTASGWDVRAHDYDSGGNITFLSVAFFARVAASASDCAGFTASSQIADPCASAFDSDPDGAGTLTTVVGTGGSVTVEPCYEEDI